MNTPNNLKETVLITGATGFLGEWLVKKLSTYPELENKEIALLSRSRGRATKKFSKIPNVTVVKGDLTSPEIFHKESERLELSKKITSIVHLAALYDLQSDHTAAFLGNVVATQNLLYFASQCEKLDCFHFTSSVVVSGDFHGEFFEDHLDVGQKFADSYAKTKAEAEFIVRSWKKGNFKKRIYRPGIVLGDSEKGRFKKIDGPYFFLEFLSSLLSKKILINTLKYLPMPIQKEALFPIVPVDWVVDVMAKGIIRPRGKDNVRCYHLITPKMPKVGRFIQDAFDQFGFSVTVIPLPESKVNNVIVDKIGLPRELLTYVYSDCLYNLDNVLKDFPELEKCEYKEYSKNIFEYAKKKFEKTGNKTKVGVSP